MCRRKELAGGGGRDSGGRVSFAGTAPLIDIARHVHAACSWKTLISARDTYLIL